MKIILFIIFFTVGLLAITASALVHDLNEYYAIKIKFDDTRQTNEKIQKLIDDHQAMICQLKGDPNTAQRLATVTLGFEPNVADTAFPKPKARTMRLAQQAMIAATPIKTPETIIPVWLKRISDDNLGFILFLAGSGLVMVSLTCFWPHRQAQE